MTEKEFLEDLKKSIQERLKELSNILKRMSDSETKTALTENHKKSLEERRKVNERIQELE